MSTSWVPEGTIVMALKSFDILEGKGTTGHKPTTLKTQSELEQPVVSGRNSRSGLLSSDWSFSIRLWIERRQLRFSVQKRGSLAYTRSFYVIKQKMATLEITWKWSKPSQIEYAWQIATSALLPFCSTGHHQSLSWAAKTVSSRYSVHLLKCNG